MPEAAPHEREQARLRALRRLDILDTAHQKAYDEIAELAADLCGTPIAAISLIDGHRQWFMANHGLSIREAPRSQSFCAHAIHHPDDTLIVSDARTDDRFADNPLVHGEPHIRFYAGVPLKVGEERLPVGALCVISNEVMTLDDRQQRFLKTLATQVEQLLNLCDAKRQLAQRDSLIEASHDAIVTWTREEGVLSWNKAAERAFGVNEAQAIGAEPVALLRPDENLKEVVNRVHVGTDWEGNTTHQTPSGQTLVMATRIRCVTVGRSSVCLAAFRDITSERQKEQETALAKRALDTAADAVMWLQGGTGKIIYVNEEACQRYQYTEDEFLALTIADIDPMMRSPEKAEAIRKRARSQRNLLFQTTHLTKDGTEIPVEIASHRMRSQDIEFVCSTVRDITERTELQRSLLRTQKALDTVPDAVLWLDEGTGNVIYANREACDRYQYEYEEFLKLNILDIDRTIGSREALDAIRARSRREKIMLFEAEHTRKDGSTYPVEVSSHLIEFDDEVFLCAFHRDISERKKTQRHQERSQFSLDTAPDAVLWLKFDSCDIHYANEEACRRYQYSQEEFLSMDITELDPNMRVAEAFDLKREELKQQRNILFETTHMRKDGVEIPVEVSAHLVEFEDELFSCTYTRDITERKRSERQRQLALRSLDTSDDAVIWLRGETGELQYVNEAACQRYQYTREELLDMTIADLDPMMRSPEKAEANRQESRKQRSRVFETTHVAKDGTLIPVEVVSHPIDPDVPDFVCTMSRDITERRETIRELRLAQHALDTATDAIFWLDPNNGDIVYANEAASRRLLFSNEELTQMNVTQITRDERSPEQIAAIMQEILDSGSAFFETAHMRKDGTTFPVEVSAHRLEFDGEAYHCGFARDISERLKTEGQLARISEERRAMLELLTATDGIAVWTVGTEFCDFSPGFRTMLGFDANDTKAIPNLIKAYHERVHPEDAETVAKCIQTSVEKQTPTVSEYRLQKADGSYLWVRARGKLLPTQEGQPLRLAGTLHDITDLKEAQAERDHLFNAGIQLYGIANMSDATWVKMSDNWEDVLGYSSEELVGMSYIDMAHPNTHAQIFANMKNLFAGVPLRGYLSQLRHKDGTYRWIEFNIAPPGPDSAFVYCVANDVTDQDHDLLRRIGDAFPATLFVFDVVHHRSVFVSQHVERVLGYTPREFMEIEADRESALVHPDDVQKSLDFYDRIQRGADEERFDNQVRLRAKNGEYRDSYVTARILKRSADGSVQQIVGTSSPIDDITVLHRYANELEAANEELENFAYVASHDLKQPLRGIDNLANWIEQDAGEDLPELARDYLTQMRGRVARMDGLLDDLLEYSRIARVESVIERVDLARLVQDVAYFTSPPQEARIEFSGPSLLIETERIPLDQVLRNLIGNAIKHRDSDDIHVLVTATYSSDYCEITVSDDGPGIAPEFHDRIFGMFQTLKPRDELEGSGMGLALAKKHIETRGGQIDVESSVGDGATFRFTWPGRLVSAINDSDPAE